MAADAQTQKGSAKQKITRAVLDNYSEVSDEELEKANDVPLSAEEALVLEAELFKDGHESKENYENALAEETIRDAIQQELEEASK